MDNVIAEESANGEHKVRVGEDEETVNEAMGGVVVEESTDGGHKMQLKDEETPKETVCNAIVEESTDGEHKVQVRDDETLNETTGNAIVEESADGKHKARTREDDALNETMGDIIVKESTDGKHNAPTGEEEALNETEGDIIVEESTDGEHKEQVGEEEALNETKGDIIVEESTDGEHKAQVGEEEALIETMGDIIVEESTDDEHKAQVREEVVLTETLGNAIVEESTEGEHQAQVREEEALSETTSDAIVEESNDDEHKAQVREEKVLNETAGDDIVEESYDVEHRGQVREEEALNETLGNAIVKESTNGELKAQVVEAEALGNVIIVESTDVEHTAQVREAEALTETMGDVLVEESSDVEHKTQVGEADVLTEIIGDVIMEESTAAEHKAQVREAEALTEIIGDVIMEETTAGEHKAQVREAEASTETIGDVIMEESTAGEHKAKVSEAEALTETTGNVVIVEGTDGEHKAQVGEEVLSEIEKQAIQSTASGMGIISPMEVGQQVTYHLPSLDKANFSISDLVWGKVKSHPWWPGQIFDPSDASKLAMKYQKKDSFLIAYYGDKTFAWCDESQLKPFHSYFSQLEKQYSSDTFIKAIHDILMEVSSRVELGMACSCLPEEDYTKIKYQKVENAGIRGGNINSIINRSTVANYFEPEKLLEYIKTLAQFPNGRVDKLEFVIAQSQLKALCHSRGYPELPVFTVSGGLMECVPENSPSSGKGSTEDFVEQCTPVHSYLISATETSKSEKSSFNKREHGVEGDVKQKSTSKLAEDGKAVHLANGGKAKSVEKAAEKPISSFSGKKHIISKLAEDGKAVHLANGGKAKSVAKAAEKPIYFSSKKHVIVESDPADSGRCKKRMLDSFKDIEFKSPSLTVTSSFKIGEFIRRAASQLTGGPPILKCQGETLQKDGPQADHMIDDVADFDVPPDSPVENQRTNLSFIEDYNSTDELLSQLCLAAKDPMEEYSFVPTIVDFFTGFRNFCVSSSSEEKEHVEKRKRGRPKKIISQQAASDIITSEDEKHVEKRKRGMNVISQLASSDISSENEKPVEKPVEKRKRGRPRKNPLPASSDSEDMKPLQKPKRGRPRGRPSKVDSQLPSPDNSSFENKKLVETRKRRRPRKVISQIVPTDMTTPDHMKDSYWSDMDLQKKSNGKSLIQYQKKRRKSTGEQSLCQLTPTLEEQLQLAMNPDMKLTFVAERSIISVEEKIMDECMPTALILIFNNANSLPSETHLIRIFSRYGPLKEAETEVLKKTNRAKVVFKRRVDAEAAFSSAGKYSIFGPGLLSYQLKPWSPKSTLQAVPLGTQEAATAAMPEDTHDAACIVTPANTLDTEPITMPQDNLDAAFITTPEDKHDLVPVIAAQDYHDLASISMVQDSHDTAQDKCPNAGIYVGSNLVLSEHAETVITSDSIQVEAEGRGSSSKHDHPELISHENQDPVVVASLLDEHNVTPTSAEDNVDAATITMVQDNPDAAVVITLQNKCDAKPTVGSNMELSEQAEDVIASDTIQVEAESKESSPHEKRGPGLIAAPEEKQDAVPIASPLDDHDLIPTSTEDKLDTAPNTMLEDGHDVAAVITPQHNLDAAFIPTPEDKHDLAPVITAQDYHDLAPISMVQDSHDTAQDKCPNAGICVGSNLLLSEHAETVIASDSIQVEAEGRGSSGKHDHPELISTSHENQDPVVVASLLDEHNLTPTSAEDNVDAATITMVQDNPDAAVVITLQNKCDSKPTVGSNMELSEQAEDVIASDTLQVEAESKESSPHEKHGSGLIAALEEKQDAVPIASPLDERDLIPTSTEDKLDAAPNTMLEDGHDAAAVITPQDNLDEAFIPTPEDKHDLAPVITEQDYHDLAPISMVQDSHDTAQDKCLNAGICVGSNLVLSEHAETVIASDSIQVEAVGRGSSGKRDHPELISHENQDPVAVASLLDEHNLTPTSAEDNVDAATITMVQDNPDAAVVIALQNKCDAKPTVGSNVELSGQAEDVIALNTIQVEVEIKESPPHEKHGPGLIATPEEKQDAVPIASPHDEHDLIPTSTEDKLDAAPSTMLEDGHDAAAIITPQDNLNAAFIPTPEDKHDLAPVITEQDYHDLAPISMVQDNHDTSQDKCPNAGICVGSNLVLSEHEETVITSDSIQVEAEGRGSSGKHDHPELISTSHENQDPVVVASLLDEHNLTPTIAEDNVDAATITMVQDNPDAAVVITLQNNCDAKPTVGSNMELSEQAEDVIASNTIQVEAESKESSPHEKHGPGLIAAPKEKHDAVPIAYPLDEHDLTPTSLEDKLDAAPSTMVEDGHDTAAVIMPQDKCDAGPTVGRNFELSEQAEDVIASDTVQMEVEGEESSLHGKYEPALIAAPEEYQKDHIPEQAEDVITSDTIQVEAESKESSPHVKHGSGLIAAPEEKQDAVPMASPLMASPLVERDLTLTSMEDKLDASPNTMVEDSHDATAVITPQDKCDAGPTVGRSLELSEKAEDDIQMDVEGEWSSPHDKYKPSLIAAPEENQDVLPITSPQDEDDSTPINTQDNLHGAPITMVEDNPDATHVLKLQHKYDAEPVAGSNLEFSEQMEAVVVSDATQVDAEGKESLPQYSQEPALTIVPQQNQNEEPCTSLLDQHDSTPTATHDNLDAAQISLSQDNHDATSFDTPQDNQDAEPFSSLPQDNRDAAPITKPQDNQDVAPISALQEKCDAEPTVGSKLSEQVEDVVASNTIQVETEGKESLPQDKLNPALFTTLQQNLDSEPFAALIDKHDSIPPTTQADLDAASICTPQDNQDVEPTISLPHDTAPITIPQDNHDAVSIATPPDNCDVITPITASQDDHDAAPIATAQDKHDLGPIIPAEDSRGLAPMTSVEVNRDAADVVALQDKGDAEHSVGIGSNLELSEQADGAVASDTIHVEAEGKELPPQDGHDLAPIAIPQQNQDTEHVALLLDKHDSVLTTTQDNLDAASIAMVPDNHDAAPITMPKDKYNAALAEGCNIQVSEQTESGVASETMQGEGCNLEVSEQVETVTASDAMQI